MTDIGGGLSTGGILGPVDWSYSSPHFNSKDFLHNDSYYDNEEEDDDDLDSYYMDLPPVDMTERLKEVNRALAEDSTPVEGARVTKLRFRDVIADFQSPRESVIASDSDDGYGDSSDIMFDAEEENDVICPTPTILKYGSDHKSENVQIQNNIESHIPSVIPTVNNDESENNILIPPTSNFEVSSTCSTSITKSNAFEGTKPIFKQDLEVENEVVAEEIPEIVEDISSTDKKEDLSLDDDVFSAVSIPEANQKEDEEKLFSKSNGRFSKCYKMSEFENLESDIDEEIEEFSHDFFLREDTEDEVSPRRKTPLNLDTSVIPTSGTKVKHKNIQNSNTLGFSKDKNCISIDISESNLLPKPHIEESSPTHSKNQKHFPEEISKLKKNGKSSSDMKHSKIIENRLSSSQPIPNIKSSLMTPSTYQPLKNGKGIASSTTSMRRSRSQTVYSSPTKSSLTNPIQSTRSHTNRKGTSPLLKRRTKFNDKKPMKAIHNQNILPNAELLPMYDRCLVPRLAMCGVRKAASTSDLCRGVFEERQQLNDDVYEKWLQDKKRSFALTKRQVEEQQEADKANANNKLNERKKMAEEAFQQWLRSKREQLRAEKRLRSERRRLDQHSSYARTRNQCDDAYAQWCKRKQEEISHRRVSGINVRSRSLERTWIQEKTNKLYNAYLSKH